MSEFKRMSSGALVPPRRALDEWREQQQKLVDTRELRERVDSLEQKLDQILELLGGKK